MQDKIWLKFICSITKEYDLYQDFNSNNYLMLNFENIIEHLPLKKIDEAKAVYLNLYKIGYSGIIEVFSGFGSFGSVNIHWHYYVDGSTIILDKSMPSIISNYGKLIWHGTDKGDYAEIWFRFEFYETLKQTSISLGETKKRNATFEMFLTDKGIVETVLPPKEFYNFFEVVLSNKNKQEFIIKPKFEIKDRKF